MIRATQPATIQSAILKARVLTDEAIRCETLSKSSEKRKEVVESSKQGGLWTDNKKGKLGMGFVATVPTRNEYDGIHPRDCRSAKNVALVNAVSMGINQRVCYECGSPEHFHNTCPKLNRAPGQAGNHLKIKGNQNARVNGNQARGRAFNMNAIEACQDPNIVTGIFSLNYHFATVLFDLGDDFSFIAIDFVSLLNVKHSILRPSYVIEIANGRKVESNRIIRGCKLELGDSLFTIDLIPFGHGSFNVIMGMDWLSNHKDVIVCHEKVVRIPLANGKVLVALGERTAESLKSMNGTKSNEPKLGDILIVRDFLEVFPEDLSGLSPQREVEFRIDLVPRATPIAKSPYRLAHRRCKSCLNNFKSCKTRVSFDRVTLHGERLCCSLRRRAVPFEFARIAIFIDLLSGYHQLRLHEADILKTAFRIRYVHFEFTIMPFRLTNAPTSKEDHEAHLKLVLELLKKEKLFAKFFKLLSTFHREFSKIAKPLTSLMQKNQKYEWGKEQEEAFQTLKDNLCNAPILSLPNGLEDFVSRQLKIHEKKYTIHDLELRACVIDFGGNWDTHLPLAEFSYNNSYHLSIRCAPFEALYGRKCRSLILWAEIGDSRLIGPELVQETIDKVVLIKERLKAARDCQKSYADNRRKPLEIEVGDQVLLKVSSWKGAVRFRKKGKLASRYVGPFEILKRISLVDYHLILPQELISVHDTFHMSNLKKCLADANLHVPLEEIKVHNTLRFVEEPLEIMDREVKKLKLGRIPIVKVHWNYKCDPEFTWEREAFIRSKYPRFFDDSAEENIN
ncbi:putative reverse transcriptase domain-containing protein [Tanacetum coccineum]